MKELETFAERVHMLRKQRGMSQKELGEASGCPINPSAP